MTKYTPHCNGEIVFECASSSDVTSDELRNFIYELSKVMDLKSSFNENDDFKVIVLKNKIKVESSISSSESYKVSSPKDELKTVLKNIRKIIMKFFMIEEMINIDVGREAIPIVGTIIYYSNINNSDFYKGHHVEPGSKEWLETWFSNCKFNTLRLDERYSKYSDNEFNQLINAIKNALLSYVDLNPFYNKQIKKDLSETITKAIM